MLIPISVVNVFSDVIPVILKDLSDGIDIVGLNTNPSILTNSFISLNLCFFVVVISN